MRSLDRLGNSMSDRRCKGCGLGSVVSVQLGGSQCQNTSSSYLLKMPPRSEALRHSGGERRLFTSAMVTLYLEVELRRDKRPGTEQNKSVGLTTQVPPLEEEHIIY